MEAERSTYLLWTRFSMPTKTGSRDAVSIPFEDSKKLLSAYTLMVEMIVLQVWTLIILAAISASMRKTHSPNIGVASAAIWNSQGSASTVLKLMAKYIFRMKHRRDRLYILLWGFTAMAFIAVGYVLSIWFPRFLLLGNGAPVNPKSIFVPENQGDSGFLTSFEVYSLGVPASLRAAGSVNVTTHQRVTVSDPLTSSGANGTIKQVGYAYNITATDFGLQHAAGLILNVQGSCTTEYRWLTHSGLDDSNMWIDTYSLYGLESNSIALSLYDGRPPIGYFQLGPQETETNTSFSIAISSAGRNSFSEGHDPVYATNSSSKELSDVGIGYTVMTRRPILSCWQNDIWSYKGHQSSISGLSSLPGLKMPDGLVKYFFQRFLGLPMIVTLGSKLGSRAIQSASTALEQTFDAGSASLERDLHQLVAASYIASKNILADTTTVNANLTNTAIDPKTGTLYPGAADFIVTSSEIGTLSVKVLIIIPVILVLLFLIVIFLTNTPASWNKAQALQATIIYSCLDERSASRASGTWNGDSDVAYYYADVEHQAALAPEFTKDRGLFWARRDNEE
ncbi:hypothetical protein MMC31_007589 [Peltigera leucophlebia]|nr:hypothetical protein [Peltigera leucophlebia]